MSRDQSATHLTSRRADGGLGVALRRPTRLSDQLVKQLATQIVSGELAPGATLPAEPRLGEILGISKPVIREAMQALASYGLVRIQQGKKTVVLEQTSWDVLRAEVQEAFRVARRDRQLNEDLYEVRLLLETAAVEHAAGDASRTHCDELDQLVEGMRRIANGSRDLHAFLSLDRDFHDSIARSSNNLVLPHLIRTIHRHLSHAWTASKVRTDELQLVADQHGAIATAIRNGDIEGAKLATRTHLIWAQTVESERHEGSSSEGERTDD